MAYHIHLAYDDGFWVLLLHMTLKNLNYHRHFKSQPSINAA